MNKVFRSSDFITQENREQKSKRSYEWLNVYLTDEKRQLCHPIKGLEKEKKVIFGLAVKLEES